MSAPRPRSGVVLHALPEGEHALSDPRLGRMLVINDMGAAVWLLLDGSRDATTVASEIATELKVDEARARADVAAFLENLREYGFLE